MGPYKKFEFGDKWIKWKDVERCPYTFRDPEFSKWIEEYDKRLDLCCLENYAEYLINKEHE